MNRTEAIAYLETLEIIEGIEFVTYGLPGSDLGSAVSIEDAKIDIENMSDDDWNNGKLFPCDEQGNIF